MQGRRFVYLGLGGLVASLGACQLLSGLSGYGETGSGGATASSSATGATASSGSGGGATTSSGSGGACSHLCADPLATCAGGQCAPAIVGGPYQSVTAISASAQGVYWFDVAVIDPMTSGSTSLNARVAAGGTLGTTQSHAFGGDAVVGGLAVDGGGQSAFFTRSDSAAVGLYQWALQGDLVALLSPDQTGLSAAGAVAAAPPPFVVWAVQVQSNAGWSLDVTNVATMAVQKGIGNGDAGLPELAADAKYVYWPAGGQMLQIDAVASSAVPLAMSLSSPDYVAADAGGGFVYWLSGTKLHRLATTGLPKELTAQFTAITQGSRGLAASPDGASIYWLDGAQGDPCPGGAQLLKSSWSGPSSPLGGKLDCPGNLALGGGYVYYTAGPPGGVYLYRIPG